MDDLCTSCHKEPRRSGQRTCLACHRESMKAFRMSHVLNGEARQRMNARCYAHTYIRRGKIKREPCAKCGDPNAQMHHADYSKPLQIEWLCEFCHHARHVYGT